MVRETRHLWVGNLPETVREDRLRDHFKRYGRVQSVKILSTSGTNQSSANRASQPNNNNFTLLSNTISAASTTSSSSCGGQNKEQISDGQSHHNSSINSNIDDHHHNFNHLHHHHHQQQQQQINGGGKYNDMLLGGGGQTTVHQNNNNNNINGISNINSTNNSGNCPIVSNNTTNNTIITLSPNDGNSIGSTSTSININSHYHVCATVSFMDIKSASKAHNAEHKFDDRILTTEYYEPSSTTLIGGRRLLNNNCNVIMSSPSCSSSGNGSSNNGGINNNSNIQISLTSSSNTSNSINNNNGNNSNVILSSVSIGQNQQYSTSNCITRFPPNHGSSDDHSPSGFDRNNFYERNTARSSVSGDQEQYIRRPNNYHHSGDVRGRTRDRLYRNGPYSASIVDRTNQVGHHRVTPSSTWYDSGTSSTTTSSRNVYGNVASAVVTPDSGYDVGLERRNSNNDDILTIKKSSNKKINKKILLRSGSESPPSCGGESGDSSRSHSRSPSSCSSTNSTTSNSNESGSPNSGTDPPSRSRNIQSAVSAPTPNTSNPNPVVHSEDNRPLAICVRNLPSRSSDTSLKDGLFHEYKKHGKVTWVKVVGQSTDRYALVCFKKPDDVEKALEVSHDKLFFGCKIEVEPYQGYDVDDNEFRPYEAELDEYHPKSTRTLFIGNLEKDITANDLRKHFECFGEIIEIDIKKQGVTAYAFCQYSDIISVVKAMRKMDGEHLGNNRIKLGFGKSMPTNCVWIDGISDSVSDNYLTTQFNRFGPVSQVAIDRDRKLALVFFEQIQYAQTAVKEMRGITLRGRKLQVDFASRECQEAFYEKLEKPLERDRSLGFETVREVSTRGFETTVSVPGARYSRYDTPSRSRTSSFSRHSNISSSGAASPSNSGGNTPRGPSRTSRVVRYPAEYYDNVGIEFPATDGRRFKNYDEYSQGSGASHEEIYDHETIASATSNTTVYHKDRLVESPPPTIAVGQAPITINTLSASSRLSIVEPEILNSAPTTPTTLLPAGIPATTNVVPLRRRTDKSPGDIRHLQKERSHLLEQLEECPSSSSDEQLFSPKKRIKFDNTNQTITAPPPSSLLQSSRGAAAVAGGDCVNNSVSSGNVIDTINVQNNSVVNQLSISNNSNNNSDSICDSSSSSNLLLLTQLSMDHMHRKSVEIRRLSECSSGQKFLSSNTNSNTINSSSNINSNNNNSRRPSTDNLLLSRRCDDHSLLNVYPSSNHNVCKRRKTSGASETEYHHSSRGRGHQLHSHHSHEASGGESADGSRPGTPLCDERPENTTLIIPTEPRRIPTARDRILNNEPLSLPLPKFALQMFQNRLFTGPILSSSNSASSLLGSVSSSTGVGGGVVGGLSGNGGASSIHHSSTSSSSSSSSSLQHNNHQTSLNSLTLSSPPPHHHHHHPHHHHHHHHHHLSNSSNNSNNQSSPKVLPPLNITQLNTSSGSLGGGGVSGSLTGGVEQPPASPSRAPSLSSNSSDSEMAPSGSPSLEERIKTLDEMFERWSGNNTNRGGSLINVNSLVLGSSSSLSSSSHPDANSSSSSLYLRHKFFELENEQPSDILKSVLAKKSIFDDDLKRLENIGDKYEPRELSSFSRSVTNFTSSITTGGSGAGVMNIGVSSSSVATTPSHSLSSIAMITKPPITTTTSSAINQLHLQQRLVGGHHTTTSSPMNSPQPISPYNSPSPSPNVVNSTIKNCVVIPKGLQYPFPSHPPNNSNNTISSSSITSTTTTPTNVTTITTSNVVISSPKPLNRSMPIAKSVSLTEKSSSLTNISSSTRVLNKSASVPGSTNTGTIKLSTSATTTTSSSSSSSLKDDNSENENSCNKSRRSSMDLSVTSNVNKPTTTPPIITTQSISCSSNSSNSSLSSSSSVKQSINSNPSNNTSSNKKDDKQQPSNNSSSNNKSRECLDRRKTFDDEPPPPNPENIQIESETVKVATDKEKHKKSKEELNQLQQTQRSNSSNCNTKEKELNTKDKEIKEDQHHQPQTEKEKEKEVMKTENEKIDEKAKENFYVNEEFSQLKRRERNSSSGGSTSGSGAIGAKRRISDTNEGDELKRIRMNNEHRKVVDRRDSRDQQKSQHKQHKSSSSSSTSSSSLHKQSSKSKENENLHVNSINNQQSDQLLSTFDLIRKEVIDDKQQKQNVQSQQSIIKSSSIDDQNKSSTIHKQQKKKESDFDHHRNEFDSVNFLENLDARSSEDDQALLAQHQHNKEKRKEHKKKQREMEQQQRDECNVMGSSPLAEQSGERRRSDASSINKNIENRKSSSSSSGSSSHRNNNNDDHHNKSGSDRKSSSSHRSQERLQQQHQHHQQQQQQKIHRMLNSSDDSDSDSLAKHNRQHSIFDIPDEGPTYISMYDKVKARSCKNMQKQEEEKKIKAKFNQLKQSRAKREEKKRSTSWDEDSDSDFDQERRIRRHNHKSNKSSFIASSSDDDNERRHLHVQIDFNTSDSEAAEQLSRLQQYKHEHDCGDTSDSSMIQHSKPRRKITSRKNSRSQGRIHFDTSDDEYHSSNQKPTNHIIKSESEESKEVPGVNVVATTTPTESQSSTNKQHNDISIKLENDVSESDIDMVKLKSIKLEPGVKSNNSSDDENKIGKSINPTAIATIKQESKETLSDIGMSGGDNNNISVKDPFDQLFSPETRRKHKKKQKRQKSLPPAIEIKIEKQDESSNLKMESPPLSGSSIDFAKTEQPQQPPVEKKKHSSKKEKRRDKEYDSSGKERNKDERKMKKSKKSKSSDGGYSFEQHNEISVNTTISTSSMNKRGEKMEDIFGPITDEDSDHSIEIANANEAANKINAQDNSKPSEPSEEAKVNENETSSNTDQPVEMSEKEFKPPQIEQPSIQSEKERHREESRKRKEKKRKEREKLRVAMLHAEDDNSVDLDEAGRALEAQLMEDCDSKSYDAVLTENLKSSENKSLNNELINDLFRYSGENDENSEVLNISDSKHDSGVQDGHRSKEKKKKKKRSKEEKHQKREHHHHHSSSSVSSSTPIKKEPPLPIKIPDTNVELSGGNLSKQSPSLPCLIEDSPPRSNLTTSNEQPSTGPTTPTKSQTENKRTKHETNFIPGFGASDDDKIHKSAVESLSKELENSEKQMKIDVDEPIPSASLSSVIIKASKSEEKNEEKSRVIISQEETEDAVAALLGESFGTSNAEDYNDCYGNEPENIEASPPNPVETVIPEEDAEEMRKALESLNAEELDIKPDTPQSENDLRIDTDTEDQDEDNVNRFKFDNPPKTPDVDLSQIHRTVIEKQSPTMTQPPSSQKEAEVKQQIITITSTASIAKSDSLVTTSTTPCVSSVPSITPRSEPCIITTQPPVISTAVVAQKLLQPVRSSNITITKSTLTKPSISPTRLSAVRPQQFTIAGGSQPQTIQQHISRANTQFIMQPPTISIPEQQHIIYNPIGVMVSPRATEPTRVHSPRTQIPAQSQFQCPEAIKRTNSPQSPNIIRSQNPRMSPQLSPVISQHSVVVQQRLSSPSSHQSLLTSTSGVISSQAQQGAQSSSGQTNIVINRVPVTPILAPIAQKAVGGGNIMMQQAPSQIQKTVNVVLTQNNQKMAQPAPVSISDAMLSKVTPSMPQPTVVTYSTTVRVVPVTTPSQQVQVQQPQQQQPKTIITTLPPNTIINQQIKQTMNPTPKISVNNTQQSQQQQVVTSQNQQIIFHQHKQMQQQQQQMFQHQKMLQQHNFANQQHVMLKQQQIQQQKIVLTSKPTAQQQPAPSQNIMILQQPKMQTVPAPMHVQQTHTMEKVSQPVQHQPAQSKEMVEPNINRSHSTIIVSQNTTKPPIPQISQSSPVPAVSMPIVQQPKTQAPQIVQSSSSIDNLPVMKVQPPPPQPPLPQPQPPQPTNQPPVQPPPPPLEPVAESEPTKPVVENIVEKSIVEEIIPELPREKKDSPITPTEEIVSEKPIELPEPPIIEKPTEPQPKILQPPPSTTNASKSLLTEENLTKLSNSQEDPIEQDSKEDSDYWSAKEVNIESVIKKVDALCSGEDTSEEGSELTKEEWNEERTTTPSKPPELPPVIEEPIKEEKESAAIPPAAATPPVQEEKPPTASVLEQSVTNAHEEEDFDEGVGDNIDKDTDKSVHRKGGRAARGKKDTQRANHNNNNKIVIQTSQLQEPYVVQQSQQSTTPSVVTSGGVQTRRGGKATSARRGRGGKQSGRHSISNATPDDRKPRNTNSESDVYEFNEDSGEEVRPRLILTIKSPNVIVSSQSNATPQVTVSVSSQSQPSIVASTAAASVTVQKQPVSTQPTVVVPPAVPPSNITENKEDFQSPAVNTRKSRRLQERDGSRNTVDDVIEDVVRNLSTSPKGQTGNSPPSSLTPPRRSTRQTATIKQPPPPPPPPAVVQNEKLSTINVPLGDVRKSPRANRVKGKDRKTSETSTDSSDEKPRSEEKSMPDLSTEAIKTTTEVPPTPIVENLTPKETKTVTVVETKEPTTIKLVTVQATQQQPVQKTPEPSEPTTLIDPVTGELMVMRQSKEGQYIPVPGAPPPKIPTPPEITKAHNIGGDSVPAANKTIVPATSQSSIVSTVSNIQKQVAQPQVILQPPPPAQKPTPIIITSVSQSNTSPVIVTTSVSGVCKAQQQTPQQQTQFQQIQHGLPPKVSTPQQIHQTPVVVNNPSQIVHQTQSQPQQPQQQTQSPKPMTLKSHVLNSAQLHKIPNPPVQQQQNISTIVAQNVQNLSNHTQPQPPPQQKVTKISVSGMPQMSTQVQQSHTQQQQGQPNTIIINSAAVNMKSLQQSGLSSLPNQQQIQQQIALQQQQLQQHSHIQIPQKPTQITQNIPHNLLVNVNHPMNSTLSQATLSPRMKIQSQQQQQQSQQQSQQSQSSAPGQSQSIPQHIHKIGMSQSAHPTHIQQQQPQQPPPQQSSQPQLVIHSSGKTASPQSIYSPAKVVHSGQTIQITGRSQPEQIIIKQAPSSSQQHQIVKQVLPPSGSIHHIQQQQTVQSSTSAHIHPSTKVVQQPVHLQTQSPVHHIISSSAPPAHHQPSPQVQQQQQPTGSTGLHGVVKPAHQQQIPAAAPPTKQLLGRHQTPQILTGSVASPPLKQQHHHSVVTVSNRATIPPISPQEQSRVHALQSGLPNPAYEASLHKDISGYGSSTRSQNHPVAAHQQLSPITPGDVNYSPIRTVPREHLMMYQFYKAQEMGHGARVPYIPRSPLLPGTGEKPDIPDMDETTIGTSPPLELRRPASGPRTTVPHSLQSPQDRATDSPQVAQVYVHGARIPHPHYPDASARYHDVPSRAILVEPPPAHHHHTQHQRNVVPAYTAQQAPPPTNLTSHIHSQPAPAAQLTTTIIDKEREQRDREQQQRRERERPSIPGYTNVPSHGSLVPAPTTGRNLQVATPPHASQVPPQGDSLLMLLQRYPVMWQGLLALKNDQAAVQMHFVFGNPQVATDSLPCNSDGSTPPLRIAQRMRLEQSQLDGVSKKMQTDNEHCMLLALPCGRDHMDVLQQSKNLQSGFITYLQQKQAAGIVNIAAPGSQQAAYVVHIFPSCDFANENLARIAPDLLHRVAEIAHLLIIIATV